MSPPKKTIGNESLVATWTAKNAIDRSKGGSLPLYPNEFMVKYFGSTRFGAMSGPSSAILRVVDVGCGAANNLRYFLDRGHQCVGVDVNQEMCDMAREGLDRFGYPDTPVVLGTSDSIPFPDNSFDLALSMKALHYQGNELGIRSALKEFHRVLKPGGRLYIQTTGPEDEFRASAVKKSNLCWLVQNYNFRSGHELGFFDDEAHIKKECSAIFSEVETGRLKEDYPTAKMDYLIAICRK